MKKNTQTVLCLILLSSGMSALACSPNLPNYQNCINQQRQSMEMQQFQGRMQQEQSLGQQQRQPYRQPYDPYAFEKATIQARQDLAGQSDIAVAFSPSTGAVGVSAVSWAQLQPNVHANPMLASTKEFALASCIDKALNLKLGGFTHKEMDKTLRKYGKKSDCKIVKEGERLEENLIAVIRGRLADGTYTLYWLARGDNGTPFSQQQPEFKSLLKKCRSEAQSCDVIGQFGYRTELY